MSGLFRISTNELPSTRVETFFKLLIVYSITMYVVEELVADTEHSKLGWLGFLWSERAVACLFTIEYFLRWYQSRDRLRYPLSLMAMVDLIAFLPFYVGFLVSEDTLHLIRTLRILRLLKYYRYSLGLQLLAVGFNRAREQLKAIGFATFVLVFVSHAAMYECERHAQPEQFGSLVDAFWFACVTVSTVGYGDIYPLTTAGRIVSMFTFITGVTLFGTFTAVMGSTFAAVLSEQFDEQRNANVNDTRETSSKKQDES